VNGLGDGFGRFEYFEDIVGVGIQGGNSKRPGQLRDLMS
jgi:hypothetical protein